MSLPIYESLVKLDAKIIDGFPSEEWILDYPDPRRCTRVDISGQLEVLKDFVISHEGLQLRELFCRCIPPWNNCWLEWSEKDTHRAVLVTVQNVSEIKGSRHYAERLANSLLTHPDIHYVISVLSLSMLGNNPMLHPEIIIGLTSSGDYVTYYTVYAGKIEELLAQDYVGNKDKFEHMCQATVTLVMWTFLVCNSKNTIVFKRQGKVKTREYAGRKKHKNFFYKFHTLEVTGSSLTITEKTENFENPVEYTSKISTVPLHSVRGNYAMYTAAAPLFGSGYVGLVYRPRHLRGNLINGVVDKDYKLIKKD